MLSMVVKVLMTDLSQTHHPPKQVTGMSQVMMKTPTPAPVNPPIHPCTQPTGSCHPWHSLIRIPTNITTNSSCQNVCWCFVNIWIVSDETSRISLTTPHYMVTVRISNYEAIWEWNLSLFQWFELTNQIKITTIQQTSLLNHCTVYTSGMNPQYVIAKLALKEGILKTQSKVKLKW